MDKTSPLDLAREGFRAWLTENHASEKECWIYADRAKVCRSRISYADAVEEAICFGWIDSTVDRSGEICLQRFSPRSKRSAWTERNLERARRLRRLGLMTQAGLDACPDIDRPFVIEEGLYRTLGSVPGLFDKMEELPDLYVRIRLHNIQRYRESYDSRLEKFIENTSKGRMYGPDWTDEGKLTENGCPLWKRPESFFKCQPYP